MEPNTTKRRGQGGNFRMVYRNSCAACKFMRNNPTFRMRVMQSKYFEPSGHETLADVVHSFGDPVGMSAMYQHMDRHQQSDVIRAQKRFAELGITRKGRIPAEAALAARNEMAQTAKVIESAVEGRSPHELALDEFIHEGHEKLVRREMVISASTLLQAIKIRSEIDKSTKDRRLDMIKSFFTGNGQKKEEATPSDG